MAIKLSRRIGPSDFFNAFTNLPTTFMPSFIQNMHHRLKHLPSSSFQPSYDSRHLRFRDILPGVTKDGSVLPFLRNIPPKLCGVLILEKAFGVPIPNPNNVKRNDILKREVKIAMFNTATRRFLGNTCFVLAEWKPQYEGNILYIYIYIKIYIYIYIYRLLVF